MYCLLGSTLREEHLDVLMLCSQDVARACAQVGIGLPEPCVAANMVKLLKISSILEHLDQACSTVMLS